jgi:hypothetical protein
MISTPRPNPMNIFEHISQTIFLLQTFLYLEMVQLAKNSFERSTTKANSVRLSHVNVLTLSEKLTISLLQTIFKTQ